MPELTMESKKMFQYVIHKYLIIYDKKGNHFNIRRGWLQQDNRVMFCH